MGGKNSDLDVLVVGLGRFGGAAALELRRLGVGFELLPGAPVAGRSPIGPELERMRRRLRLLMRGRRPLRAVSVGALGDELLGLVEQPGPRPAIG